jgi:hypothetical protein
MGGSGRQCRDAKEEGKSNRNITSRSRRPRGLRRRSVPASLLGMGVRIPPTSLLNLRLHSREKALGTHWVGSSVVPRARLVTLQKRKICLSQDSNQNPPALEPGTYIEATERSPLLSRIVTIPLSAYFLIFLFSIYPFS